MRGIKAAMIWATPTEWWRERAQLCAGPDRELPGCHGRGDAAGRNLSGARHSKDQTSKVRNYLSEISGQSHVFSLKNWRFSASLQQSQRVAHGRCTHKRLAGADQAHPRRSLGGGAGPFGRHRMEGQFGLPQHMAISVVAYLSRYSAVLVAAQFDVLALTKEMEQALRVNYVIGTTIIVCCLLELHSRLPVGVRR